MTYLKYLFWGTLICSYPLNIHGATSYAKMEFVRIPAGIFTMGSQSPKLVQLSAFSLGKTEVTQAQWKAVMGYNPSETKGNNLPVENVSWEDAMIFCKKLTERERNAGRLPRNLMFTLPTEAQWEYACRAGTKTRFCFGDSDALLPQYGNFMDKSYVTQGYVQHAIKEGIMKIDKKRSWNWNDGFAHTAPVGSFRPNAWGLYDMHGNVFEWCLDYYNKHLPGGKDPVSDNPGDGANEKVVRGGFWGADPEDCQSACRRHVESPDTRLSIIGFRVAIVQSSNP